MRVYWMKLRKRYKYVLEILVVIAVVVGIQQYQKRHLVEGTAPAYVAEMLTGGYFDSRDIAGKPYLLHFWATWCPVCDLEKSSIQSLSKDYRVISVAMQSGDRQEVNKYMQEHSLDFITLLDEQGQLASRFGVRGVPTSLVIDRQGNIVFSEVGYTTGLGLRLRLWLAE